MTQLHNMAKQALADIISTLTGALTNLPLPQATSAAATANPLPAILNPFESAEPIDLTPLASLHTFATDSTALEETWEDGTIQAFPSFLILADINGWGRDHSCVA